MAALSAVATIMLVRTWVRWKRDRDSGVDPSTLEPGFVAYPALATDLDALRDGTHRLLVDGVASRLEEVASSRTLYLVSVVSTAQDLVPVVHRIHQRLLSLYPDVDEAVVERARSLESQLRRIVSDGVDDGNGWMAVIRSAGRLVDELAA